MPSKKAMEIAERWLEQQERWASPSHQDRLATLIDEGAKQGPQVGKGTGGWGMNGNDHVELAGFIVTTVLILVGVAYLVKMVLS